MVLVFHLRGAELLFGGGGTILPAFAKFGVSGVDLFFVISGFIMATITRGKFGKPNAAHHFLSARLLRVFPPYWLYSLGLLLVHFLFGLGDPVRWQNVDVVRSLLLLPQDQLPILVVGWTLVHELYFYIAMAVLLFLPERFFTIALCAWTSVIAIAGITLHFVPVPLAPMTRLVLHPLTIEFVAGCLVARLIHTGFRKFGAPCLGVGALLLVALFGWFIACHPENYPRGWMRLLIFGMPSILIVYGATSLEFTHSFRFPRLLRFVGDISYSMYLIHVPIILALGLLWSKVASPGIIDNLLAIVIISATIALASAISYRIVEQPMRRTANLLKKPRGTD